MQNLRTVLTDEELTDQVVRLTDHITAWTQAGETDKIPDAAISRQAKIDTLHARVIGQCEGCAETADGRWGHRFNCAVPYMQGAGERSYSFDQYGRDVIVLG
jgi:hypothetical protein